MLPPEPTSPVLAFGLAMIRTLQGARTSWLDGLFVALSHLGSETFLLVTLPLAFAWAGWRFSGRFAGSILTVCWLSEVLKSAFQEPRPFQFDPTVGIAAANGFSLPSGHASLAAVYWGCLALHLRRRSAWTVALLLIFGIGLSRVYLGVHFPTDVLAGWALGGLVLIAALVGNKAPPPFNKPFKSRTAFVLILAMPALLLLAQGDLIVATLGTGQGLGFGLLAARHYMREDDPPWKQLGARGRTLSALVALILTGAVYLTLHALKINDPAAAAVWRWVRYACLGLTVSFVAPWVSQRLPRTRPKSPLQ